VSNQLKQGLLACDHKLTNSEFNPRHTLSRKQKKQWNNWNKKPLSSTESVKAVQSMSDGQSGGWERIYGKKVCETGVFWVWTGREQEWWMARVVMMAQVIMEQVSQPRHGQCHHRSWGDISPTLQRWGGQRGSKYIVNILYTCNKKYILHVYSIIMSL